jgi:biopolymer transport protein ExbD
MHGSGDEGAPNLTPLLDLVLQLILFLLLTANFVREEAFDDTIQLPEVQQARPLDFVAEYVVYLNLDKDGDLLIPEKREGQNAVRKISASNEASLKAYLQSEKIHHEAHAAALGRNDIDVTVVVRADKELKYLDLYRVLDACRRAKYHDWQLRAMTR